MPEKRQALHQLAALLLLAGMVVIGGVLSKESPADAAELRISVGELRSQAAELAVLEDQVQSARLSTGTTRRHVEQLGRALQSSVRTLTDLRPQPDLLAAQREAAALAERLERRIDDYRHGQEPRPGAAPLRDDLQRIEHGLRQPA